MTPTKKVVAPVKKISHRMNVYFRANEETNAIAVKRRQKLAKLAKKQKTTASAVIRQLIDNATL